MVWVVGSPILGVVHLPIIWHLPLRLVVSLSIVIIIIHITLRLLDLWLDHIFELIDLLLLLMNDILIIPLFVWVLSHLLWRVNSLSLLPKQRHLILQFNLWLHLIDHHLLRLEVVKLHHELVLPRHHHLRQHLLLRFNKLRHLVVALHLVILHVIWILHAPILDIISLRLVVSERMLPFLKILILRLVVIPVILWILMVILIIIPPSIPHIILWLSSERYVLRLILEPIYQLEAVRTALHLLAMANLEVGGFVLAAIVVFVLDLAPILIILST